MTMLGAGTSVRPADVRRRLLTSYPSRLLGWVGDASWGLDMNLPLSKLQMDRRPAPRDPTKVSALRKVIAGDRTKELPPIVVVKTPSGDHRIADGYHRALAYRQAGRSKIPAYVGSVDAEDGPWVKSMHLASRNMHLAGPGDITALLDLVGPKGYVHGWHRVFGDVATVAKHIDSQAALKEQDDWSAANARLKDARKAATPLAKSIAAGKRGSRRGVGRFGLPERNFGPGTYDQITDDVYLGGAITSEGMLQDLASKGVTNIINMQKERDDSPLVAGRMGVKWVPIGDDGVPKHRDTWLQVADYVRRAKKANPSAKFYFHCAAGINRGPSGAFAGLIALGVDPAEAKRLIQTARPVTQHGLAYAPDIERYAQLLQMRPGRRRTRAGKKIPPRTAADAANRFGMATPPASTLDLVGPHGFVHGWKRVSGFDASVRARHLRAVPTSNDRALRRHLGLSSSARHLAEAHGLTGGDRMMMGGAHHADHFGILGEAEPQAKVVGLAPGDLAGFALDLVGPKGYSHGWIRSATTSATSHLTLHRLHSRLHSRMGAGAPSIQHAFDHQKLQGAGSLRGPAALEAHLRRHHRPVAADLAVDLAGRHIPGTPFRFRHGWIRLDGGDPAKQEAARRGLRQHVLQRHVAEMHGVKGGLLHGGLTRVGAAHERMHDAGRFAPGEGHGREFVKAPGLRARRNAFRTGGPRHVHIGHLLGAHGMNNQVAERMSQPERDRFHAAAHGPGGTARHNSNLGNFESLVPHYHTDQDALVKHMHNEHGIRGGILHAPGKLLAKHRQDHERAVIGVPPGVGRRGGQFVAHTHGGHAAIAGRGRAQQAKAAGIISRGKKQLGEALSNRGDAVAHIRRVKERIGASAARLHVQRHQAAGGLDPAVKHLRDRHGLDVPDMADAELAHAREHNVPESVIRQAAAPKPAPARIIGAESVRRAHIDAFGPAGARGHIAGFTAIAAREHLADVHRQGGNALDALARHAREHGLPVPINDVVGHLNANRNPARARDHLMVNHGLTAGALNNMVVTDIHAHEHGQLDAAKVQKVAESPPKRPRRVRRLRNMVDSAAEGERINHLQLFRQAGNRAKQRHKRKQGVIAAEHMRNAHNRDVGVVSALEEHQKEHRLRNLVPGAGARSGPRQLVPGGAPAPGGDMNRRHVERVDARGRGGAKLHVQRHLAAADAGDHLARVHGIHVGNRDALAKHAEAHGEPVPHVPTPPKAATAAVGARNDVPSALDGRSAGERSALAHQAITADTVANGTDGQQEWEARVEAAVASGEVKRSAPEKAGIDATEFITFGDGTKLMERKFNGWFGAEGTRNEKIANDLARAAGAHMARIVIRKNGVGRKVAYQEMLPGVRPYGFKTKEPDGAPIYKNMKQQAELRKIAALDYIVGNADRVPKSGHNLMAHKLPDGHEFPVAIDMSAANLRPMWNDRWGQDQRDLVAQITPAERAQFVMAVTAMKSRIEAEGGSYDRMLAAAQRLGT